MTDEVTLRYTGPGHRFRMGAFDLGVTRGETVDVDADAEVNVGTADDPEPVSLVDFLVARHGFERVVPDYTAVLDQSVDGLEDALATGEFDDILDALAHAEREGQNRSTALDAIHARRDEAGGEE